MLRILPLLKKNEIPDPPYEYEFLLNLAEKDRPRYLEKLYKYFTGEKLNLKNPKTFGEKIQWLKLYDSTSLKTRLTDKVLVRDWIKEKIGAEFLKPVLQVCESFDEVNFDVFPESFIIKTNHGCKWHYVIKNKTEFLNNPILMEIIKSHFEGWLQQTFFPYAGFEMQYKDIKPQIIVEPLLRENIEEKSTELEIYCFNGVPRIFQKIKYSNPREVVVYDCSYNILNLKFLKDYQLNNQIADENVKLAVNLSKKLATDFKLVRIDWLFYKDNIYFNEMTFTPFSGFYKFENKAWNYELGKMLKLNI